MTELLLPIMGYVTIGLVVLLIVVEVVGLSRIVRRCDADTKKKWKAAILSLRAANRGLRAASRAGDGEAVVESQLAVTHGREDARAACDEVREKVNVRAAELRKQRRKPVVDATAALVKFVLRTLMTATLATVVGRATFAFAGTVLFLVLLSIQLLYYAQFDFNVLQYLADYSVPGLLKSLLQVSVLLVLLPFLLAGLVVLVPPLAGLLLVRGVDGIRAAAANALAWLLFTACRRWTTCSHLALPLLDETSVGSAPESGSTDDRRLVSPSISFVGNIGSKLLIRKDGNGTSGASRLSPFAWPLVAILFLFSCTVAVWVEPRYRAHAACAGPMTTKVVLEPSLQGGTDFTKIGSIGGHVFIVSESCRFDLMAAEGNGVLAQAALDVLDVLKVLDVLDVLKAQVPGLQYVVDQIQGRRPFLGFFPWARIAGHSTGVTVVPLGRVLCMYDVHEDRPNESVACGPRSDGAGLRITVQKTDNTWTIVLPPDVRMDDEWRLKAEIAQRICNGGAAEISDPVLFERGETTPADVPAAEDLIKTFVSKPELQKVKLHVLGFASGDGNRRYNENLARQRATAVAAMVRKLDSSRKLREHSWGETHLTNGVANSRSARIVGCRSEAGAAEDSSDSSDRQAQQAPAATTAHSMGVALAFFAGRRQGEADALARERMRSDLVAIECVRIDGEIGEYGCSVFV